MFSSRTIKTILSAAILAMLLPAALPAQDTASGETARLTAVLASDAPVFEKAMACRRLSLVGDESATAALAALLDDEQLSTYARSALEAIPGDAPDVALREALTKLNGVRLVGVLASIGVRGDAQAIEPVAALLDGDDPAVAAEAARTLGYIGTPAAADVLQKKLSETAPEWREAAAKGCLICAQTLAKQDEKQRAVALCDAIAQAEVPEHLRLAAQYDAVFLAEDGLPRLIALLESEDEARFRLALQAARQWNDKSTAAVDLMVWFKTQPPERQTLTLIALGDLGLKATLPIVAEAARSDNREVRIEAIHALATLGDGSVVAVLLEAAAGSDAEVAEAARSTLAVLQSDQINAAIVESLGSEEAAVRAMAIDLAAQRHIAEAAPALLQLAESSDAATCRAAVEALGATAGIDQLDGLLELALERLGKDDFPAVADALQAACVRMPRQACAEKLVAAMQKASPEAKVFLLEQLTTIGGPTALTAVAAAARSDNDTLQDAGTRLLGQWLTADAAPVLLDLSKTLDNRKYKVRAIRGYVRIARQLNMTSQERLDVCRNTLKLADSNDDKRLVFEVLRRYPTPENLTLAVSLLDDKALQNDACTTIVAMAGRLAMAAPEPVEKALTRVVELTGDAALKQEARRQLAVAADLARQQREEVDFQPLFDGATLAGWLGDPGVFHVEQGAIVGGDPTKAVGTGNDFLCSEKEYENFELRLQFKLTGENANGGVGIRCQRNGDNGEAAGYQADMGDGWWGCLFDELRRRRLLAPADPKPTIQTDQWNDYRIRCEGKRIRLWVNGVQTVDYTEPEANIPTRGVIALQVQANRPSRACYRNIRIKPLTDDELETKPTPSPTPQPEEEGFAPLFDGKTLEGWKNPSGVFRVEEGQIVGGNLNEPLPRNEFLRSEKTYGDFELRLEFKMVGKETNGGVQIRTREIPNNNEVSGYQADLGDGWWGCLYDESRRNRVLAGPSADRRAEVVRLNEWNDYRILCQGKRIQLWVNGVQTVDYTEQDENIPLSGIIALQVHGGLAMEARYRNIRIKTF